MVGIYACGPTVYSRIHIGNARPFVVFSLLRRFLESEGYAARLVVNVTDVNDKIYRRGERGGPALGRVGGGDDPRLHRRHRPAGVGRPDAEPLATETMSGIVALIYELVEERPCL